MPTTEERISRRVPRHPFRIVVYAWLIHMALMMVAIISVPWWSPEPAVAWLESADPTGASAHVIDFFEHTPRVEALLDREAAANYAPGLRDRDRLRYAVSHMIIEFGLVLILVCAAVPLFWGIRRVEFFLRYKGIFRPGMSARPIVISCVIMLVMAVGMALPLYGGAMTQSRRGSGPSDALYVFQTGLDFALLFLVCNLVGFRRLWLDRKADAQAGPISR